MVISSTLELPCFTLALYTNKPTLHIRIACVTWHYSLSLIRFVSCTLTSTWPSPCCPRFFLPLQSQHQNYIVVGSSARKESETPRRVQGRRWVWTTCLLCCFVSFVFVDLSIPHLSESLEVCRLFISWCLCACMVCSWLAFPVCFPTLRKQHKILDCFGFFSVSLLCALGFRRDVHTRNYYKI